jgi:ectoine hydroxylase-related dioxygenase (phytanoyl-CoA dioxygenase family)
MAPLLRAQLEGQGFAIVRGVVPPSELAEISEAFDRLLAAARSMPGTAEAHGARFVLDAKPFRLHRVVWCGGAEPVLARYGSDPRFLGLAAQALGSTALVQLIQQAHFKLPNDSVDFAWHQDASNRRYGTPQWTDVNGCGSFVQVALAVDPMGARNGGLRFLPGSQAAGFVADPQTGELPPDAVDEARAVEAMLDPGDVVLFGPFVLHGSGPNTSAGTRRLFLQGYALPGANHRLYPGCGLGVARRLDPP